MLFGGDKMGDVRMLENGARKSLETSQSFFKDLGSNVRMHK